MNEEKQQLENIFNPEIELMNSKNREKQQLINVLLNQIQKEEDKDGNREVIQFNN